MAIACTRCGRQYDVTLFQFGRTINCACGERVGFEHRLDLGRGEELKFFADVNAASVVRWLRAMGIDTAWEDAISDAELVRRAIVEKRYVLTLDKRLLDEWRADNVLLLKNQKALDQLREIVRHFNLPKPKELFTRCLVCNTPLRPAEEEEIAASNAPACVLAKETTFYYCPTCRQAYWLGSHTRRMREAIERVFGSGEWRSEK
jgi:uncharacterized protein